MFAECGTLKGGTGHSAISSRFPPHIPELGNCNPPIGNGSLGKGGSPSHSKFREEVRPCLRSSDCSRLLPQGTSFVIAGTGIQPFPCHGGEYIERDRREAQSLEEAERERERIRRLQRESRMGNREIGSQGRARVQKPRLRHRFVVVERHQIKSWRS